MRQPDPRRPTNPPPDRSATLPPDPQAHKSGEQRARDALARKLRRSRHNVPAQPRPRPPVEVRTRSQAPAAAPVAQSRAEVLRNHFESAGANRRQRRLDRYLKQAQAAERSGDTNTAIAAYEQALRLAPDDAEIGAALARLKG